MRELNLNATPRDVIQAVNELVRGRSNANGTVTLTPNAATTVIAKATIGPDAAVALSPMTANAAAALATTYVSAVAAGQATLTHANNAQTDRTFRYTVIGG